MHRYMEHFAEVGKMVVFKKMIDISLPREYYITVTNVTSKYTLGSTPPIIRDVTTPRVFLYKGECL